MTGDQGATSPLSRPLLSFLVSTLLRSDVDDSPRPCRTSSSRARPRAEAPPTPLPSHSQPATAPKHLAKYLRATSAQQTMPEPVRPPVSCANQSPRSCRRRPAARSAISALAPSRSSRRCSNAVHAYSTLREPDLPQALGRPRPEAGEARADRVTPPPPADKSWPLFPVAGQRSGINRRGSRIG